MVEQKDTDQRLTGISWLLGDVWGAGTKAKSSQGVAPEPTWWPPGRSPTLCAPGSYPLQGMGRAMYPTLGQGRPGAGLRGWWKDAPRELTEVLTMMMYQLLTTVSSNKVTAKGKGKEKDRDQTHSFKVSFKWPLSRDPGCWRDRPQTALLYHLWDLR